MPRNTNDLLVIATAILFFAVLSGCKDKHEGRLLSAIDDEEVYDDKTGRYKSMSFFVNSYFDYSILSIKILPIDKSGLEYSINAPAILGNIYSLNPDLSPNPRLGTSSGGDFVWDRKWVTPKQFKVWWQRMVDFNLYAQSSSYDDYKEQRTKPGTAWCEATITINKPLPNEPGYFVLNFYPDGHVDAYISELKDLEAEIPRVKFEDRLKLPILKDKPCLKGIGNPYFG